MRKYKVVRQPDEMACGNACLATICEYYGVKNVSLSIIRNFAQTDRNGNSIYSLRIAAEKLNMKSQALRCNKKALLQSDKITLGIISKINFISVRGFSIISTTKFNETKIFNKI